MKWTRLLLSRLLVSDVKPERFNGRNWSMAVEHEINYGNSA
jgi:hypothetical protein